MMWLALGIALTPVAILYWIARTACDGARLMYIGDVPERLRTQRHVFAEHHSSQDLNPAAHGHDLPKRRVIVGDAGGQSIHSYSIIQPEQRNHG